MKVLVVEDEAVSREAAVGAVEALGHECLVAKDGDEAWDLYRQCPVDVIVSDWRMPGIDGLELCQRVRNFAKATYTYFILLTVMRRQENLQQAMEAGVDDFLSKPLDADELAARFLVAGRVAMLHQKVERAKEHIKYLEESSRTRTSFQDMIGKSPAMQEVYRRIRLAAQTPVSVLIFGESGTGKELAARAIHSLSARSAGPFIGVNCGALTDEILESELFGHLRGAFTGAVRDREGLIRAADGGTLFLDEIAEMSPALQVKLLRVLQENEVRPVGSTHSVKVDVRIIAATNSNLKLRVESEDFREDLYYRVRVFQIDLPSLRDRVQDIPLLADHFIRVFSRSHGKEVSGIDQEALDVLMQYPWPGNVRELQNIIEQAFVTVAGNRITIRDLPEEICSQCLVSSLRRGIAVQSLQILDALQKCNGNRTEAAKLLGMSRVGLWKKIRRLGIEFPSQAGKEGDPPLAWQHRGSPHSDPGGYKMR